MLQQLRKSKIAQNQSLVKILTIRYKSKANKHKNKNLLGKDRIP